jgi:hypothetical protein
VVDFVVVLEKYTKVEVPFNLVYASSRKRICIVMVYTIVIDIVVEQIEN